MRIYLAPGCQSHKREIGRGSVALRRQVPAGPPSVPVVLVGAADGGEQASEGAEDDLWWQTGGGGGWRGMRVRGLGWEEGSSSALS